MFWIYSSICSIVFWFCWSLTDGWYITLLLVLDFFYCTLWSLTLAFILSTLISLTLGFILSTLWSLTLAFKLPTLISLTLGYILEMLASLTLGGFDFMLYAYCILWSYLKKTVLWIERSTGASVSYRCIDWSTILW